MKYLAKPIFNLSLLSIALCSGFAHAQVAGNNNAQTLPTVEVRGSNTSTHRINTKKFEEATSTDLKDVLFNEPSVSFGGGNGTS